MISDDSSTVKPSVRHRSFLIGIENLLQNVDCLVIPAQKLCQSENLVRHFDTPNVSHENFFFLHSVNLNSFSCFPSQYNASTISLTYSFSVGCENPETLII